MEAKIKAYQLHLSGLSYKQIGDKLGISKTSAYEYVKETKLTKAQAYFIPVPNGSEPVLNECSEPKEQLKVADKKETEKVIFEPKIKEFTGDELIQKKFEILEFTGKFLELIGKPSKLFSGIIWGSPKGGKSSFAIRLADYLHEYFGNVVYVAAEEGESVTLQEKFKEIEGSKLMVLESRNRDLIRDYLLKRDFNFVFIDSINNAGIDNEFLELLKNENPNKSFVSIVQATKGGNFKGDQALTHNCDFIIKVVDGIAYHTGRFNVSSEIKIFEEPLYVKNKAEEIKIFVEPLSVSNKVEEVKAELPEALEEKQEPPTIKNAPTKRLGVIPKIEYSKPKRKMIQYKSPSSNRLKEIQAKLNTPETNWASIAAGALLAGTVILVNLLSNIGKDENNF